jgi:putative phosphoribosyl transferase
MSDHRAVEIGTAHLPGELTLGAGASGIVLFAHGSGSSRLSPRNRLVAEVLQRRGLGTVLFDLLDEEEVADRSNVFDIDLLATRVGDAIAWVRSTAELAPLKIGLFGASTGAAAALRAAAAHPSAVSAVVSRGGRPDLATDDLERVLAPTLLIVGADDTLLIEPHRAALRALNCEKRLVVVPGATHLFEEPGALDEVARLAGDWFADHLGVRPAGRTSRTGPANDPRGRSTP